MILLLLSDRTLVKSLTHRLSKLEIEAEFLSFEDSQSLVTLYEKESSITGIVADASHSLLPENAWFDVLDSFSRKVPVICVSPGAKPHYSARGGRGEDLIWIQSPSAEDVISVLARTGLCETSAVSKVSTIETYDENIAAAMLRSAGTLSVVTIYSNDFRKIAIKYGQEAYSQLQSCFKEVLLDLWGAAGSFRQGDLLCRQSSSSNSYLILLEPSRGDFRIPAPGSLEKISERLSLKMQELLWQELFKPRGQSRLPSGMTSIPQFSLGHGTAIHNSCVDIHDVIAKAFESAREVAAVQSYRTMDRSRELMQALISSHDFLVPNYQAVVKANGLTRERVEEAVTKKSLAPFQDYLYAFESLIRVNPGKIDEILKDEELIAIKAKHLRPDILFHLADVVKLTLELDQACLRRATQEFSGLPGNLMVNILPRNFDYIEEFQTLIRDDIHVTFEVSESEAISNFSLLTRARDRISGKNKFEIAIDDFGKGYAGLDRIITIKPDVIKLDRSLIQDIHQDNSKKAFVSGIINAAQVTQSLILAEGVETLDEFDALMTLGVDLFQGFLFHRPQSAQIIREDLDQKSDSDDLDTVA